MAERSATLGVTLEVQLAQARAQYEEFRSYVAQNPPTATIATGGQPGVRTSTTFGGLTVATTAPPNPSVAPPPAATAVSPTVILPHGATPAQVQIGSALQQMLADAHARGDQASIRALSRFAGANDIGVQMPAAGAPNVQSPGFAPLVPTGSPVFNPTVTAPMPGGYLQTTGGFQQYTSPIGPMPAPGQVPGRGGGGHGMMGRGTMVGGSPLWMWSMNIALTKLAVDQAMGPIVGYRQQGILMEGTDLMDQARASESAAAATYNNPANYLAQKFFSSSFGRTHPFALIARGLGHPYEDPDEALRGARDARRSLEAQQVTDVAREGARQARERAAATGFTGYRSDVAATEAAELASSREFARKRQALLSAPGAEANAAYRALYDEQKTERDLRTKLLATSKDKMDYEIASSDVDTARLTATGSGSSKLDAERRSLVDQQRLDLAVAVKMQTPAEANALQRKQRAELSAWDFNNVTQGRIGIQFGTAQAVLIGQGQDYAAGLLAIQEQNYQQWQNTPWANRPALFLQGLTKVQAYQQQFQRQSTATTSAMDAAARAQEFSTGGYRGEARRAATEANFLGQAGTKYIPVLNKNGEIIEFQAVDKATPAAQTAAFNRAFGAAIAEGKIQTEREDILIGGSIRSMEALLARRPLASELEKLRGDRAAALAGVTNPLEQGKINSQFDLREMLARQADSDRNELLGLGLGGEAAQIAAGRAFKPVTADVIGKRTATMIDLQRMVQQGVRGDLIQQAGQNAIASLDFTRESYLRDFRGVQTDISNLGAGNARQKESPADIVKAIEDTQQQLRDILAFLREE